MTPDDARAASMREFGNVTLVTQTTREVWSIWVEQLLQDLRFARAFCGTRPASVRPRFC